MELKVENGFTVPLDIHTSYESLGDFKKAIPQYLGDTVSEQNSLRGMMHEHSFYLNSSDSLETLTKLDMNKKRVMTVSGSGEFALVFINDGASEICNFDVSPAAAFNAELRYIALCTLNMKDYMKLFDGWTNDTNEETVKLIWDEDVYKKIEGNLSEASRLYFDNLFKQPELINFKRGWNGFVRVRYNKNTKYNRLVGDIIKNEDEYIALQEKARKVRFTQVLADVNSLEKLVDNFHPDTIYLSNIGYQLEATLKIANKYIKYGVPEVICTVSSNDEIFNDVYHWHEDSFDSFYFNDRKIVQGNNIVLSLWNEEEKKGEDVSIQILGTDRGADYGLTLKVTK